MTHFRRRRHAAIAGIGILALAGTASSQQETASGVSAVLDISTGITSTDNPERLIDPDGDALLSTTDLLFDLTSRTTADTLTLQLGLTYEDGSYPEGLEDSGGVENAFLNLRYVRESRNARLQFDARLSERDNGFSIFETGDTEIGDTVIVTEDLILDQGTRRDGFAAFALEVGRAAPFGLSTQVTYGETLFFDTTDASLSDFTQVSGDIEARLSFNRTTDLFLFARGQQTEEDNAANTTQRSYNTGLGLAVQVDPATRMRVDLAFGVSETEETDANGVRDTTREEGPVASLTLDRAVRNGSFSFSARSTVTSAGTQTDLRFGRVRELENGRIAATLGIGMTDDGRMRGVGSLDWTRELRRSSFGVGVSQALSSSVGDDFDTLNTQANVRYSQQLSDVSGLQFSLQFGTVTELGDSPVNRTSATAQIDYTHQITRDWRVTAGYRHSLSEESDRDDITENEVFATIGRRFNLRP